MSNEFFPLRPAANPTIYAYIDSNPAYAGLLKIGYTTGNVEKRVAQQYPTLRPGGVPYKIVFQESAMYPDGSIFTDREIHRALRRRGIKNPNGEWFACTVKDLRAAIIAVKEGIANEENRDQNFPMRPEQQEAVEKTIAYYADHREQILTKG